MVANDEFKGFFDVIYADPAWKYASRGARGGKYGELDYNVMENASLADLPVGDIAARDAALFMWTTSPFMPDALALGEKWGFNYIRVDKVWAKIHGTGSRHGVVGPWGLTDVEFLLLFARGKMCSKQAVTNQYTMAWPEEYPGKHSAKPAAFRDQIRNRFPRAARVELFARESYPGWFAWGDEAPGRCEIFIPDDELSFLS